MEGLLLLLDAAVIIAIVFFSVKNDRIMDIARQVGPFRIHDAKLVKKTDRAEDEKRRRERWRNV